MGLIWLGWLAGAEAAEVHSIDELLYAIGYAEEGETITVMADLAWTASQDCVQVEGRTLTLTGDGQARRVPALNITGGAVTLTDLSVEGVCQQQALDIGGGGTYTSDVVLAASGATLTAERVQLSGGASTTLVGVHVAGGDATFTDLSLTSLPTGFGLLVGGGVNDMTVRVSTSTFEDNAGYAVAAWGSRSGASTTLLIDDSAFSGNGHQRSLRSHVSDIVLVDDIDLTVSGSTFVAPTPANNAWDWVQTGAALTAYTSNVTVRASSFTGHRAQYGGAIYAQGDGSTDHELLILDTTFSDAIAEQYGGALFSDMVGLVTLSGVSASGLASHSGAFAKLQGAQVATLEDVEVLDWELGWTGGAVYLNSVLDATLRRVRVCGGSVADESTPQGLAVRGVNVGELLIENSVISEIEGPGLSAIYLDGGRLTLSQSTADLLDVASLLELSGVQLTLSNNLATRAPDAAVVSELRGLDDYGEESGGNARFEVGELYGGVVGPLGARLTATISALDGPIDQIYDSAYVYSTSQSDAACAALPLPARGGQTLAAGLDTDGDGEAEDIGAYGGPGALLPDEDGDGWGWLEDCDDLDATAYPGAEELPYDGVDQDCDGSDLVDVDGDGWGWLEDCDDLDATVHPGAEELPYDGVDQDCDQADLVDVDGDGVDWVSDCDDEDAGRAPGLTEQPCDGVDQDCDGEDACAPGDTDDPEGERALSGGCACGGGAPPAAMWWLALGALLARRRR